MLSKSVQRGPVRWDRSELQLAVDNRKSKKKKVRGCPVCSQRQLGGGEIYVLKGEEGLSIFDVARAVQIVSDGRHAQVIDTEAVGELLGATSYEEAHLVHVDPALPGIVGQRFQSRFLLDGVHRAARCLKEGRPFHAFVLSAEETRSSVLWQEIGETNVGLVARELRLLLAKNPESDIEVEIPCSPESVIKVRKLLTKGENARVQIRNKLPLKTSGEKS